MEKKALFDALVAKHEQRERSKHEVKLFEVQGVGKVEFVKPREDVLIDYFGRLSDAANATDALALADDMIFDCCPTLQDKALQDACGVSVPTDIVPALLTIAERNALGGKLFDWLGLTSSAMEDTAKNS